MHAFYLLRAYLADHVTRRANRLPLAQQRTSYMPFNRTRFVIEGGGRDRGSLKWRERSLPGHRTLSKTRRSRGHPRLAAASGNEWSWRACACVEARRRSWMWSSMWRCGAMPCDARPCTKLLRALACRCGFHGKDNVLTSEACRIVSSGAVVCMHVLPEDTYTQYECNSCIKESV